MISSLFISVPLEIRLMTLVSMDTARLPAGPRPWTQQRPVPGAARRHGACENRALLIPRLKSFSEAGAPSRARLQYIAIAKASCQAFTGFTSRFFFDGRKRTGAGDAPAPDPCRHFRRRRSRRNSLRAAPI